MAWTVLPFGPMVAGVLFDVDGTLVDSNDAHAHAWVEAFAARGFTVPFERVRRMIGMGGDKLIHALTGLSDESEDGRAISERRRHLFLEKYVPTLRPCRGARDLVRRLHDERRKLAVASSARADELTPLLRIAGVDDFISVRTSSDDADESKPDPDIVRAALQRIDLPPSKALLIGDTPYDIEAGSRAGVAVVALRCGGWDDAALTGAVAIYDDPADLLGHLDTSPLSAR